MYLLSSQAPRYPLVGVPSLCSISCNFFLLKAYSEWNSHPSHCPNILWYSCGSLPPTISCCCQLGSNQQPVHNTKHVLEICRQFPQAACFPLIMLIMKIFPVVPWDGIADKSQQNKGTFQTFALNKQSKRRRKHLRHNPSHQYKLVKTAIQNPLVFAL